MRLLACLMLMISSCATTKVHRSEWLACCRMCEKPQHMDYVAPSFFGGDITCHCTNGNEYSLKVGYSY